MKSLLFICFIFAASFCFGKDYSILDKSIQRPNILSILTGFENDADKLYAEHFVVFHFNILDNVQINKVLLFGVSDVIEDGKKSQRVVSCLIYKWSRVKQDWVKKYFSCINKESREKAYHYYYENIK